MVEQLKERVLAGEPITCSEAVALSETTDKEALYKAAAEITSAFNTKRFDSCSIINARSGHCPEDCKWCAQSMHHKTDIQVYGLVSPETSLEHALWNQKKGVKRFSLVTSGRKVSGNGMTQICNIYKMLSEKTEMSLCASLGLLSKEDLTALKAAGVNRYHCNLETAPSYFPELCSTHTQEEKIETIKAAQEVGMEICSGGIIGMGETM
ncbi:MAG: biotin synthase BioB, partial [Coprobacter sp.]|nr:biotin synthase BioB [Coprobacter sp.]